MKPTWFEPSVKNVPNSPEALSHRQQAVSATEDLGPILSETSVAPAKTVDSRQKNDAESARKWPPLIRRVVLTGLALGLWFWMQSLIAHRAAPPSGVGDALHTMTAGLNSYFYNSPNAARFAADYQFSSNLMDSHYFCSCVGSSGPACGRSSALCCSWDCGKLCKPSAHFQPLQI